MATFQWAIMLLACYLIGFLDNKPITAAPVDNSQESQHSGMIDDTLVDVQDDVIRNEHGINRYVEGDDVGEVAEKGDGHVSSKEGQEFENEEEADGSNNEYSELSPVLHEEGDTPKSQHTSSVEEEEEENKSSNNKPREQENENTSVPESDVGYVDKKSHDDTSGGNSYYIDDGNTSSKTDDTYNTEMPLSESQMASSREDDDVGDADSLAEERDHNDSDSVKPSNEGESSTLHVGHEEEVAVSHELHEEEPVAVYGYEEGSDEEYDHEKDPDDEVDTDTANDINTSHNHEEDTDTADNHEEDASTSHDHEEDTNASHGHEEGSSTSHDHEEDTNTSHDHEEDTIASHDHEEDTNTSHNREEYPSVSHDNEEDTNASHDNEEDTSASHDHEEDTKISHDHEEDPETENDHEEVPDAEHHHEEDTNASHDHEEDTNASHDHEDSEAENDHEEDRNASHDHKEDSKAESDHEENTDNEVDADTANDHEEDIIVSHDHEEDSEAEGDQEENPNVAHEDKEKATAVSHESNEEGTTEINVIDIDKNIAQHISFEESSARLVHEHNLQIVSETKSHESTGNRNAEERNETEISGTPSPSDLEAGGIDLSISSDDDSNSYDKEEGDDNAQPEETHHSEEAKDSSEKISSQKDYDTDDHASISSNWNDSNDTDTFGKHGPQNEESSEGEPDGTEDRNLNATGNGHLEKSTVKPDTENKVDHVRPRAKSFGPLSHIPSSDRNASNQDGTIAISHKQDDVKSTDTPQNHGKKEDLGPERTDKNNILLSGPPLQKEEIRESSINDDSINEPGLGSQSHGSEESQNSIGSYVVLAVIMGVIVVLLGYSVFKSKHQNARERKNEDFGTEMVETKKTLLPGNGFNGGTQPNAHQEADESNTKLLADTQYKEDNADDEETYKVGEGVNGDQHQKDHGDSDDLHHKQDTVVDTDESKFEPSNSLNNPFRSQHEQSNNPFLKVVIPKEEEIAAAPSTHDQNEVSEVVIEKPPSVPVYNGYVNGNHDGQAAVHVQVQGHLPTASSQASCVRVVETVYADSIAKKPVIINRQ
jgi:hypothetical protein